MSHTPPVPDGARSPYPIEASQAAGRDGEKQDLAKKAAATLQAGAEAASGGSQWPRFAAGAAIGSAAIAAGLLFYNRSKAR